MSDSNYWSRRLSRRSVVRGAALSGVGLAGAALIGCGGDEEEPTPAATATQAPAGDGAATPAATEAAAMGKRGGTLKFHISAEPPNFDMHANSTYAVAHPVTPMYNQLVQFDPMVRDNSPDSVIPDLAESWEVSDDGLKITFNLVQNASYHEGQPFTSADVAATFGRIMDPPDGVVSVRRDQFKPVSGIETPDDYTVVFNLERPVASMLALIATPWNCIYSAADIAGGVDFKQVINGTGPFRLKEYQRGNRVEMVRNESYFHDMYPYFDGITVFIVPDNSTALAAFQSGELDVHRGPSPSDVEAITAAMGDTVDIDGPMPSQGFGSINYALREPWTDVRVRRAISMAMSQDDSITVFGQGQGYVGGYLQPGGTWAISEDELRKVPGYEFTDDALRAEARKLLDAAGLANPFETTLLTRKGASFERLSLYIADQLTRVGVNATLDVQETASAYDIMNQRAFDMAPWSHGYALDDPDALWPEFYLLGAPRNYSEQGSPEIDAAYLKQSSEIDPEARLPLVHELEILSLQQYGKTILSWSTATEARYKYVKDRVKHNSTYGNQRWERVWFDL